MCVGQQKANVGLHWLSLLYLKLLRREMKVVATSSERQCGNTLTGYGTSIIWRNVDRVEQVEASVWTGSRREGQGCGDRRAFALYVVVVVGGSAEGQVCEEG